MPLPECCELHLPRRNKRDLTQRRHAAKTQRTGTCIRSLRLSVLAALRYFPQQLPSLPLLPKLTSPRRSVFGPNRCVKMAHSISKYVCCWQPRRPRSKCDTFTPRSKLNFDLNSRFEFRQAAAFRPTLRFKGGLIPSVRLLQI